MKNLKNKIKSFLRALHLFDFFKKIYLLILKTYSSPKSKRCIDFILKEFNDNSISVEKCVFIFQRSYYTQDGTKYISGGGERYASDISDLIFDLGYTPILFQIGAQKSDVPWINKRNNLMVIGFNISPKIYNDVLKLLPKPALTVYSGLGDFLGKKNHPNIFISHGVTWDNPIENAVTKDILKLLYDVDSFVSVDTNTISWLRCTFSNTLSKTKMSMCYIPNYADLHIYKKSENVKSNDRITITFPRRCSPERGFWLINQVLPTILKEHKNVDFQFIGFIHDAQIANAIELIQNEFPGRVRHSIVDASEMNKVYQESDISIIPTLYSEGTSLSCIEAMACGNVVISTNIGGLTNLIIDKYNGLLINPDAYELLNALNLVINNPDFSKKLSENALSVSSSFSKEAWEEKWKTILKTNIGNNQNKI